MNNPNPTSQKRKQLTAPRTKDAEDKKSLRAQRKTKKEYLGFSKGE
ncbi:MAG: hypothetical protein HON76_04040 [Candidatus Scalindua sp.]|jgi:hypothetical protein|nr:hypothetical protein [Candidatus Scalindua sp.]MBT6052287.1 hypothetical protein [Candidatus Scalindua sp.]MBT6561680.1 hypothetical protein [Candidatus Scalindua sp.]MBT7589847.1 hypothetical protein [Candidatus Scalindua sp.]